MGVAVPPPAPVGAERLARAMYDFANSGYITVVLTTVFNAHFVAVAAERGGMYSRGVTLLWTVSVAMGNVIRRLDTHHQTRIVPALTAWFGLCSRKGADWTQISHCRTLRGSKFQNKHGSVEKIHVINYSSVGA